MNYGRINERNTGSWSNGSTLKGRRLSIEVLPELTADQDQAYWTVKHIDTLISGGLLEIEEPCSTVSHWLAKGVIKPKVKKSRFGLANKEVYALVNGHSDGLKITKGLLIEYFGLAPYKSHFN